MPLITKSSSETFHSWLYAGQMGTVTLLKRGDDQQEGSVIAYTLYECRRSNMSKTGEPIQGDMPVGCSTTWQIPAIQLRRINVNYLNVLDRIVDQLGMYWQPESGQSIILSQFDSHYIVSCVRIDPSPNTVLLGTTEFQILPLTNP